MDNRVNSESPTAPMSPAGEPASMVEDFMDILYAPTKVFTRRAASGFGMYLLIIAVLAGLFAFAGRGVFSQIFDAEFARSTAKVIEKNPQAAAQVEAMKPMNMKIASLATYIGTPIFIFILGLFTWIAAKIVGAKVTYGQTVLIITLAWIPRLVGSLVSTLQIVLMDTSNVTTPWALSASPARFMPDTTSQKVIALLGSFDAFSIWYTVVVAIGIAVIGKVSPAKGYVAAFLVFAIGLLPALMR
jgi:hypothetical protein